MPQRNSILRIWIICCLVGAMSMLKFAQAQENRYQHTVFKELDTIKNVQFAMADWLNNHISLAGEIQLHAGENITENRPLEMDIFSPKDDTLQKRPVIIFLHAGGFLLGSRKNEDMIALCDSFARRGYVTATMDYRVGIGATISSFFGIILSAEVSKTNGYRAVYRAIQDSRAAVRFLKHNAETYKIDTSKIYMIGSSAGAFAALHNLYLDSPEEIPEEIKKEPDLGGLDEIGIQNYHAHPNAIVSMWGALQTTRLIENNNTPLMLIHGEADEIVPFKEGVPLQTLVPDNDALNYTMPPTYGSFCIDTAFQNKNLSVETYFLEGANHEFYGAETGEFPEAGPNEYWDIIQTKISDFLHFQITPKANFEFETDNLSGSLAVKNTSNFKFYSEWDFGDGTIKNEVDAYHTFENEGDFLITLKTCDQNLWCDSISKLISIAKHSDSTAVFIKDKVFLEEEIALYPNPAVDNIYVENLNEIERVVIYNLWGRKVYESKMNGKKIPIKNLKNGIYLMQLHKEGNHYYKRFVKSN